MTTSPSFSRIATVTGTVKRNTGSGTTYAAATATGTTVYILPLMPVSPEIVLLYTISSPRESYVTYCQGAPNLIEGDVLTVSTVDHRVKAAGPWPTDNSYYEIILERIKGT